MTRLDTKRIDFETTTEFKKAILKKCIQEERTLKWVGLKLFDRWLKGKYEL